MDTTFKLVPYEDPEHKDIYCAMCGLNEYHQREQFYHYPDDDNEEYWICPRCHDEEYDSLGYDFFDK